MAMSNQLHTLATLPLGRKYVHKNMSLVGPQSHSRCLKEEKNFLSLPGIEPRSLSRPAHSLAALPTEQTRFGDLS
jgi:hypothetical protein